MRWLWGKDEMVFYAERPAPGVCRVSENDMEVPRLGGWYCGGDYDCSKVDCFVSIKYEGILSVGDLFRTAASYSGAARYDDGAAFLNPTKL